MDLILMQPDPLTILDLFSIFIYPKISSVADKFFSKPKLPKHISNGYEELFFMLTFLSLG